MSRRVQSVEERMKEPCQLMGGALGDHLEDHPYPAIQFGNGSKNVKTCQ